MQILRKECIPLTHSDIFFLGTNPSKRSITGLWVSGVEIGLNEANLINDIHLITSFVTSGSNPIIRISFRISSVVVCTDDKHISTIAPSENESD